MVAAVASVLILAMTVRDSRAQLHAVEPRAADKNVCPYAGQRPPADAVLQKGPKRQPLCKANFTGANLTGVDFTRADLALADFSHANLTSAILTGADLHWANLTRAILTKADFTDAKLAEAWLIETNLAEAKLTRADLTSAYLNGAFLSGTILTGADLGWANLTGAMFEPQPGSLASVIHIELAQGLAELTFWNTSSSLVALRKRFADDGMRQQEREITFAKLRTQRVHNARGSFWKHVEGRFSYVAFELTCGYGLHYGRPLHILFFVLIPLFTSVYTVILRKRSGAGLWRVWSPDRILTDEGQATPERLWWFTPKSPEGPQRTSPRAFLRALGFGFLFSLLSSFQIGWRDLNVGNWITRVLPHEYTLRATGWVRVVSGLQSLVSVYLLALWALTYFGRPFE